MDPKKNRGLGTRGLWPLLSHGSSAKELLIERLNAQQDGALDMAQVELRELVRNFNYVESCGRKAGFAKLRGLLEDFSLKQDFQLRGSGLDESIARRMKRIKAVYSSVRFTPWPAFPEKDGWRFYWPRPWHMDPKNKKALHWMQLAFIYDFALSGELRLVRQCDHCHQWFFGKRGGTRFCPDKDCREKHWRKSPEGRAMRAAYMRDYYHKLKKEGEEALKAVKRVQPAARSSTTKR